MKSEVNVHILVIRMLFCVILMLLRHKYNNRNVR